MKKECFLICPIGGEDSKERKNSDTLLKHILNPIAEDLGYKIIRADKMPAPGIITTQILNKIIDSPLVIADLTGSNPNVFYELALRHSVNKPFIQLITGSEKIPFDVSGVRTIHYDLKDLDKVEATKEEIIAQIKTINSGHTPDSPISLAIKSEALGVPPNTLEVFLEKFWNIEDDMLRVKESIKNISEDISGLNDYSSHNLEYSIENALENKLPTFVDAVVEAIEGKT